MLAGDAHFVGGTEPIVELHHRDNERLLLRQFRVAGGGVNVSSAARSVATPAPPGRAGRQTRPEANTASTCDGVRGSEVQSFPPEAVFEP